MSHLIKCRPNDQLPIGLPVHTQRGVARVHGHINALDQFKQPIVVHKLRYSNGAIRDCNYSFIYYDENELRKYQTL